MLLAAVVRSSAQTAVDVTFDGSALLGRKLQATGAPSGEPTGQPTTLPTSVPTTLPTAVPTTAPTSGPSLVPTTLPTPVPTAPPTKEGSVPPTFAPTAAPSLLPTISPAPTISQYPTTVRSTPVINSTAMAPGSGQGRLRYTYIDSHFNFREHANAWRPLCPSVMIHDSSSTELSKVYVHFDPAYYDDDELRYPGEIPQVRGSYDDASRTMVLSASEGKPCGSPSDRACGGFRAASVRHFEAALRTVRYKAKESLSVKDRPNVHTRLVWISAEDAEGWRGEAFAINITLSTASTVLTDRTATRHGR